MTSPDFKAPSPPETPFHTPYMDTNEFLSPSTALTAASPPIPDSALTQTPSMLVVLDDAASFAETVKQRTRQRREKEDAAIASIKVQTKRLEAALTAEIKRRVDAVQTLQQKASAEIKRVEEKLQTQITQDRAITEERLNLLEERIALLECKWQSDINTTQQEYIRTAHQLQEQVAELKQQSALERQARLEREASLTQQITQLADEYKVRWEQERQERYQAVHGLTEKVDANDFNRIESERSLDHRIGEELRELEKEIGMEQKERELADQEIVAGLNRYIESVRQSLEYVSGV